MGKSIAWIDKVKELIVEIDNVASLQDIEAVVKWKDRTVSGKVAEVYSDRIALLSLEEELPLGEDLKLIWGKESVPVFAREIVRSEWFEEKYDASDVPLGARYSKSSTSFSVWAPTATRLRLDINGHSHEMERQEAGVWHRTVKGNLHGAAYSFQATVNGRTRKVNDPYAKSMTANSRKSVVLDLPATDPSGFRQHERPSVEYANDVIIYELHVRDASAAVSSGIQHKKKFLGLTEKNTHTETGYSTGLSYIKELGCTHVQLLPINDFGRVDELKMEENYNWGYDPLFFQSPEGSYASDPADPEARVREGKQMIQSFHEEELSVILDVVYNHVFKRETSPFEKLVPGYYFRYHDNGEPSNGTGTGNDVATERKMVRKFVLDSIDYWLKEYRVDGFRFDLMGEMDVRTMQEIRRRCQEEDKLIILLGEGWELDTPLPPEQKATIFQSHQLEGIAFFNDKFRDTMKGTLFEQYDQGYANGKGRFIELMPLLTAGSCVGSFGHPLVRQPAQSVNYVECHDNHTLWDRLQISNGEEEEEDRKKIHQLATGLTLLSQGIPFLQAGQEWYRTKNGEENSYISGDEINQLDWQRRAAEDDNIQWIKTLISIRKKYSEFRLRSMEDIRHRFHVLQTPATLFGFLLFGDEVDLAVFVNPTKRLFQVHLPSPGRWEKLTSNHYGGISPVSCLITEHTEIQPYELFVLEKQRT